jgi:exopolyphosphatase/guanosine-5'-triphosphate,3'-diphosphate pyrophosphatase
MENKIAVIDMGTNTFHLMIAKVEEDDFAILSKEKIAVRLGAGGISEGKISKEAIQRALAALKVFKAIIDKEKIELIYATGTSALRNAENGPEVAALIEENTGIKARIISGLEEAELIYFGVSKALKIGSRNAMIMDIGGGSVEFIICSEHQMLWAQSFEIGGQRLMDKFHTCDPMNPADRIAMEDYLAEVLSPMFQAVKKHKPKTLIGCSGTFDTLSDIHRLRRGMFKYLDETELPLDLQSFYEIYEEILSKTREERLLIPGMIEMRVDMIVVAVCLIHSVLAHTKIKGMRGSAYALKEGVLLDAIGKAQRQMPV